MSDTSIIDSLRRLDEQLFRMIDWARLRTGREPGSDPFRGLYVSESEVVRSLANPEDTIACGKAEAMATGPRFDKLGAIYGLSRLELDALLIALAPEIEPRYERIFAYLQDDVSRRRPSIDLVLSVLCDSVHDKFALRSVFDASNPLRAEKLIRLLGDELTPVPRRELCPDPRIAAFLTGETGLDARLTHFVRMPDGADSDGGVDQGLLKLARRAEASQTQLRVFFRGCDDNAKQTCAVSLAATLKLSILVADMSRASHMGAAPEAYMEDLAREARLREAIVYLEHLDWLPDQTQRETVLASLDIFPGIAIVSSEGDPRTERRRIRGAITISFDVPNWTERRAAWKEALREHGVRAGGNVLDSLAECFRFNRSQIEDAAQTAAHLADYRGEIARANHVFEASRQGSGHELASLTRKVTPVHGWPDMVLPGEAMQQLREICRRVERRHQVLGKWGFERKLSGGKGINALFHGHSGTGKTMAAEVVAHELHLDLYKIDLAGVVSKYIGETEKNLDRIFAAAENANAILLFDEADALFGKRSEVRDAHDRYANLEVSYLLQKMEQHEGVSILSTNLRQNLDEAFLRRLTFTVQFPFPDESGRERIWRGIWPKETPLATDVDALWLAERFMLSGGNIRNVALASAYLAVEENSIVTLSHVLRAIRNEFQKLGKTLTPAELEPPIAAGVAA